MRTQKDFEDPVLVHALTDQIATHASPSRSYAFMEVCGTHTQAIGRWGLRGLLPKNIRLVSGPGCPVCITPGEYIDNACHLALQHHALIATFGDLIRVPGNTTSLESAQGEGGEIHTVYSAFDCLRLAVDNPEKQVVFLAIGFETTIAGITATIQAAHEQKIGNLSFYLSLRRVPPALQALIDDPAVTLDGFLLPGHVSAILGIGPYRFLEAAGMPGTIVGFEPVDILRGIVSLLDNVNRDCAHVRNLYPRAVRDEGNPTALSLMERLLEEEDAVWRGIGRIPQSGYALRHDYRKLDAANRFALAPLSDKTTVDCQCGDVLKGVILPDQCPLFGQTCTPENPVGPCMVSGEGSCAAYYHYQSV